MVTPMSLQVFMGEERSSSEKGTSPLPAPSQIQSFEFMLAKSWGKAGLRPLRKRTCAESCVCLHLAQHPTRHGDTPSFHTYASPTSQCYRRLREVHHWRCPAPRVGREHCWILLPVQTKPHLLRSYVSHYFVFHSFISNHCSTFCFTE